MRILPLVVLVVLGAACTKPNPNRCCINEEDCTANNIPLGSGCDDGLVCRGNFCIAQLCESNAVCDPAAPFCVSANGTCQEQCSADEQCPGFGQAAELHYCESGLCVECRDSASDCSGTRPVCSAAGACVACSAHDQCSTGVCTDDGSCAPATQIAYVDPSGSAASECTAASPCSTIERGLALQGRPYVLINGGTYSRAATLTISDTRTLIGNGAVLPVLRRSTDGPIISAQAAAKLTIDRIEISGGTGSNINGDVNAGYGIGCYVSGGSPSVDVRNSRFTDNVNGVFGRNCVVRVTRSSFTGNEVGMSLVDSMAYVDRSVFTENGEGLILDAGTSVALNNLISRNQTTGINFYASVGGSRIEHNTIVDNGIGSLTGTGFACATMVPAGFPNNIIARNREQITASNCTFPSSIIIDADISSLKFKQPDTAPYDYHLLSGSIAIDMAAISTLDHDIDGESRPKGAGRDIGADEAE